MKHRDTRTTSIDYGEATVMRDEHGTWLRDERGHDVAPSDASRTRYAAAISIAMGHAEPGARYRLRLVAEPIDDADGGGGRG